MEPEIKALVEVLIEGQLRTDKSVNALAVAVNAFVASSEARAARNEATLDALGAAVTRFVESSEARAKSLEENLDGLIRAITSEHKNGKSR